MGHGRIRTGLVWLLLLVGASPAAAQDWFRPDPTAEPWRDARLRIGPLFFDPAFTLRDLGLDQNVFNDVPGSERRDLTGTLAMNSLAGLQIRRLLINVRQTNSYIWYRTYRSERSVDGSLKGTGELRLGVLRPWASWERSKSHERSGYEIDARAGREFPAWDLGTDVQLGWRIGLTGAYRRRGLRYAEGEQFDGVDLKKVLDHKAEEFRGFGRLQLTDFTAAIGGVEYKRLRFDQAVLRDHDEHFYFAGLESTAESRLQLNLKAGWLEQRHQALGVKGYTGVAVTASTAFVVGDFMQIRVGGDRKPVLSYEEQYPYYIEQGGEVRTIVRFMPQFDLRFDANVRWLKYRETLLGPDVPREDRATVIGGEFGYFLGGTAGTRVALRYEHARRDSPVPSKNYMRNRLYSQFQLMF